MIPTMTTNPMTTPITIHFQSSSSSSVTVTVVAPVVGEVTVVTLLPVGVVGGLVGIKPNFISAMGTPNKVSSWDLELFTTCRRAATGVTAPPGCRT